MAKILKILAKILFQLYSSSSSSSSQASLYLRELGSFVPSSSTPLTHWTDILHIYPIKGKSLRHLWHCRVTAIPCTSMMSTTVSKYGDTTHPTFHIAVLGKSETLGNHLLYLHILHIRVEYQEQVGVLHHQFQKLSNSLPNGVSFSHHTEISILMKSFLKQILMAW